MATQIDTTTGEILLHESRAMIVMPDASELQRYQTDEALIALSEAVLEAGKLELASYPEVDGVLDSLAKLKAIREYMLRTISDRKRKLEAKNNLTELVLRDQRYLGNQLAAMPKNSGARGRILEHLSGGDESSPPDDVPPTLAEMSVTKKQSSRWQLHARLPDELFESALIDARENEWELSTYDIEKRTVLYLRAMKFKEDNPDFPTGKYRVIYADPPWDYGNTMPLVSFGEQADHYPPMSMEDICAMDVAGIADDDAVLFLWVTSPILEESFEVVKAWGFQYKASFVWDKQKHVMGHYNSVRHELLLVCVRGSCQPDVQKLFDSVISEERTEHSRKPEVFRQIIDTIYPYGKRIELFARRPIEGWEAYGNEIS